MASYGTGNVTETSFDFYAHGFSGDLSRRMCIKVGSTWRYTNTISAWQSSPYNGQMTVSGLSPGTTYAIEVRIGTSTVCANNTLMYTGSVTTKEKEVVQGCIVFDDMELISSSYSNGTVSAKIRIYYYNDGATRDTATIYYQIGGNGYFSQSVSASAYGSGYIDCNMSINTGTLSGTSYTFNFNGYIDSSNCGNDHFSQNLTASWTATARPSKFYWISSSQSLTKGATIKTYITASKWKALQTNVNAVRVYKKLSNFNFTTVSSGQRIMASHYNEIANAINAMLSSSSSYWITLVNPGDPITASVMNKLQNSINSIT
jgi:hypothetical protein